ncbi:MAG: SRPBCC family protein [Flammeovirgaceae bacterium]|nr:SRPBCC family protein [Flammeovirgaceae bacterium]
MTTIELETKIEADIHRCFDLTRDIDIHKLSTEKTNEKAIAGRTSGLCELGDRVTWEAKHFGIRQRLSVEITKFNKPHFFEDRMIKGAFKSMRHEHHFKEINGSTMMTDRFMYHVPFGIFGELFDRIVLKSYMTGFLVTRNKTIKKIAERK